VISARRICLASVSSKGLKTGRKIKRTTSTTLTMMGPYIKITPRTDCVANIKSIPRVIKGNVTTPLEVFMSYTDKDSLSSLI
jgi:hypothetical protein